MQYTTLGHSGIKVSKLCLGGMSFGEPSPDFHQWTIGPDDTRAVIKRALDTGINFIDTANCYSFGTSEEYIGAACAIWESLARASCWLARFTSTRAAFPPTPSNARSKARSSAWAPIT